MMCVDMLGAVAFAAEYTWNKWEFVTQFDLILSSEIYYKLQTRLPLIIVVSTQISRGVPIKWETK